MIRRSTCWRLAALLVPRSTCSALPAATTTMAAVTTMAARRPRARKAAVAAASWARSRTGARCCGVDETVPGFGLVDEAGDYAGFDIEFCKAVAAAVLGDSEAVEYVSLNGDPLHLPGRRHRRADPQHHLHRDPRRHRAPAAS